MLRFLLPAIGILLILHGSCRNPRSMNAYSPSHADIKWSGRYFKSNSEEVFLVGSAASLKFRFKGDKCIIRIKNLASPGQHHYLSWVLDGIHSGRKPVRSEANDHLVVEALNQKEIHEIEVFKETEPSCGFISIGKIEVEEILPASDLQKKKIEFIGNSITAGMSSDASIVPCGGGGPCDQHNAFESYGALTARNLNLDFMISAVSGIGVYRNSASAFPVMRDLYESTALTGSESDPPWDFNSFVPDIVCINLGTNDFSDAGGDPQRLPFDSSLFISKYIELLTLINNHYPESSFILLQHSMSGVHYMDVLSKCLDSVKHQFAQLKPNKSIEVFAFSASAGKGCFGHPDVEEHRRMAGELSEFLIQRFGRFDPD